MKKLFLIDSYAMIYRAYYALIKAPRVNSKGLNTSAILGFLNSLHEIISKEHPDYIAAVFDPSGPTFRHEAYPEYKAQREATPEDIRKSIPIIKELIRAHNIPVITVDGYEADDVIGTLAFQATEPHSQLSIINSPLSCYMVTPDKDYGQLVSPSRLILRPRHGGSYEVMGEAEVIQKWQIDNVSQVTDLLGLMGDTADNIPGCPKVGPKTAADLLHRFGSIDNLLSNTDSLKGALKTNIENNRDQIMMSQFLARIKTDVPVTLDLDSMKFSEPDTDRLVTLYTDLEFRKELQKLQPPSSSTSEKASASSVPDLFSSASSSPAEPQLSASLQPLVTQIIPDSQLSILNYPFYSIEPDIEAEGTPDARLIGLAVATEPGTACYIPASAITAEQPSLATRHMSGHNLKRTILALMKEGIPIPPTDMDIMIAHYIINPELKHTLEYLTETILSLQLATNADHIRQTCCRADAALRIRQQLQQQFPDDSPNTRLLYDMEMPLIHVLARMETNGVLIDDFALTQSADGLKQRLAGIEREAKNIAGDPSINISSPKQVGILLYEKLHIAEKPRKTKTGQYATDEETLMSLKSKNPVITKILEYRGIKKLLSTYIEALPKLINRHTGRIHTSFNQTVTATGRLSSSNPNLQNIPVRDNDGKYIRQVFIAEQGCTFLSADYSQVELRIMAHLSNDRNLVNAFMQNMDIHAATASHIYHVAPETVTSDMRRKAKTANFGIIYGISAFGLAERLDIPRSEAKQLIDEYFASFPGVKDYIEKCKEHAHEQGYVETIFGRRRYLSDINSRNANVRSFAERNAVNAPIQGSAADIIKLAMIRIDHAIQEHNMKTKMILQVHDELNFNVPDNEIETIKEIVRREMESVVTLHVPLKVDIGTGHNWLEAH